MLYLLIPFADTTAALLLKCFKLTCACVCVPSCRILECERKKKKKFQGMSALKERLKYYDLLLKRLQDIMDERNGRH